MIRLCATTVVLAVALAIPAHAQQYRGRLSLMPLDIAMQNVIAGSGMATGTLKGTTLVIAGTFSGLKTPATIAKVYRSPKPGMRGVAIGDLTITADTSGKIEGTIELTKEQVADLAAGRIYVQLHSQKAPDGNLWGWLFAAADKK